MFHSLIISNINLNWFEFILSVISTLAQLVVIVETPPEKLGLLIKFFVLFTYCETVSTTCFYVLYLNIIFLEAWDFCH
jgi:hypothetical protein